MVFSHSLRFLTSLTIVTSVFEDQVHLCSTLTDQKSYEISKGIDYIKDLELKNCLGFAMGRSRQQFISYIPGEREQILKGPQTN